MERPVGGFGDGVVEIVVPPDYKPPKGALYKARGLEYGMTHSTIPDDAWILHCDEESHIDPSLLYGTYHAVQEEEASGEHRIGQGAILYHNSLEEHSVLTMADAIRTGDDIGRFHLQNRLLGLPIR